MRRLVQREANDHNGIVRDDVGPMEDTIGAVKMNLRLKDTAIANRYLKQSAL
jgi:hypothetical protein